MTAPNWSSPGTRQPKVSCPHCGKRLRDENGVRTHIIAKHGGKGRGAFKPTAPDDDDESFADRAVQAEIDRACGIPSDDDWLLP
jgi:hypothetical protein